jgi:hypothetical protein
MLENPYKPPTFPLHATESGEVGPRKRFRFRLIPATICFVFGGIGVAGTAFQAALIAALIARDGPDRFNLSAIVVINGGQFACYVLFVLAGWLWIRGRWFRALAVMAVAYGIGVAVFSGGQAGEDDPQNRAYFRRFLKPVAPAGPRM